MRNKTLLSMAVATLALAGCGTIVNGGSQTVDVIVKGSPSAFCTFSTSTFKNSGSFPNTLTLERSREPLVAECRGEQNLYKKFEIAPIGQGDEAVTGNIMNGTTVLGGAYDSLSGGAWGYPDPLIVDFRVVKGEPDKIWPDEVAQSKIIAPEGEPVADIQKPNPLRMQPVMDEEVNPATKKKATALPKSVVKDMPVTKSMMQPVVSPEDDPAYLKAKAEAAAKAAAAKKKAAAEAAAKKKAAEEKAKAEAAAAEAEKAAAEAAAKAAAEKAKAEEAAKIPAATALPQVEETAPAEPAAATDSTAPTGDMDKYLTGPAQ